MAAGIPLHERHAETVASTSTPAWSPTKNVPSSGDIRRHAPSVQILKLSLPGIFLSSIAPLRVGPHDIRPCGAGVSRGIGQNMLYRNTVIA
jgi:hypothetical protein